VFTVGNIRAATLQCLQRSSVDNYTQELTKIDTMKMFKSFLFMSALFASVLMTGCDDDEPSVEETDGLIASQTDPDLVVGDLRGEIVGDITLNASEAWLLTGPLVVNDGATLTIEAGTTIKAQAGGTDVYIAVERGAKINAVGTAASPIKITSSATAPKSGDWGGLMIMGKAKITGGGLAVTEVVDFIYGNGVDSNDADDSGDLSYVILEYTGARINGEKEFNGLTLYGVGTGTTINNIAIFNGDDDGIEWFGGAVDVSNVLVVNATDDMFDWTQGWSGTATNVFGVREAGYDDVSSDPRGLEGDGNPDGLTPNSTPQSDATFVNVTIASYSTAGVINDVFKIRRGSKITMTNALAIWGDGVPAPGDVVDYDDGAGAAAPTSSVSVSLQGANLSASNVDNKLGADGAEIATITFPDTPNTGCSATLFAWTGYDF
jgi:hypothetical protein